jgi:hypothetical protein
VALAEALRYESADEMYADGGQQGEQPAAMLVAGAGSRAILTARLRIVRQQLVAACAALARRRTVASGGLATAPQLGVDGVDVELQQRPCRGVALACLLQHVGAALG